MTTTTTTARTFKSNSDWAARAALEAWFQEVTKEDGENPVLATLKDQGVPGNGLDWVFMFAKAVDLLLGLARRRPCELCIKNTEKVVEMHAFGEGCYNATLKFEQNGYGHVSVRIHFENFARFPALSALVAAGGWEEVTDE